MDKNTGRKYHIYDHIVIDESENYYRNIEYEDGTTEFIPIETPSSSIWFIFIPDIPIFVPSFAPLPFPLPIF